jgi:thiamine pyrophosphate-dependent acetolactate synthase large subunit-like protein
MAQNVSEFVWKRLSEWGISRVYGYPGDGVGGLDVALERAKDYMPRWCMCGHRVIAVGNLRLP